MGRVRQADIRQSESYNDSLTPGDHLGTGGRTLQDDLNALRSILKRLSGLPDWCSDLGSVKSLSEVHAVGGVQSEVVGAVLETEGPGAGIVPTQRTFADGTVKDYTYQADGITVDEITITRPGQSPATYQVDYTAEGIAYKMTLIP